MCLLKGPCEGMGPDSYLTGLSFRLLPLPLLKFPPPPNLLAVPYYVQRFSRPRRIRLCVPDSGVRQSFCRDRLRYVITTFVYFTASRSCIVCFAPQAFILYSMSSLSTYFCET